MEPEFRSLLGAVWFSGAPPLLDSRESSLDLEEDCMGVHPDVIDIETKG